MVDWGKLICIVDGDYYSKSRTIQFTDQRLGDLQDELVLILYEGATEWLSPAFTLEGYRDILIENLEKSFKECETIDDVVTLINYRKALRSQ